MLCLSDSIRHDDLSVQQLLKPIEEAQTLTQLILAVRSLARVLALHLLEYVLAECVQQPTTWPPCPRCGTSLRSKGFAQRQLTRGKLDWREVKVGVLARLGQHRRRTGQCVMRLW